MKLWPSLLQREDMQDLLIAASPACFAITYQGRQLSPRVDAESVVRFLESCGLDEDSAVHMLHGDSRAIRGVLIQFTLGSCRTCQLAPVE